MVFERGNAFFHLTLPQYPRKFTLDYKPGDRRHCIESHPHSGPHQNHGKSTAVCTKVLEYLSITYGGKCDARHIGAIKKAPLAPAQNEKSQRAEYEHKQKQRRRENQLRQEYATQGMF